MDTPKNLYDKNELIADALLKIANELKFLGNGNADRSVGHGSIEGLAMKIYESNQEIASAREGIASAIERLSDSISAKLGNG